MRRASFLSVAAVVAVAAVSAVVALTGNPSGATAAPGTAPAATTGAASDVGSLSAKLSGVVNPNGSATSYTFQYGTGASYGSETTHGSAGAGTTAANVSATLTGLAPGTTYHYRLTATNASGQTTSGADHTFTTGPRSSRLGLSGHTAFVGPGRQVGVFAGCFGGRSCKATLKATRRGHTIGSRSAFYIRPNGGGIVHVPLNSYGRKVAAKYGLFHTKVTVSSSSAGTDSATVAVVRYSR